MSLGIDKDRFEIAHEAFKQHMLNESGIAFTNFQHPFLIRSEIAYKWKVYHTATQLLNLSRWASWQNSPGKIVHVTKEACKASENLLVHRYGPQNYSEAALYKVENSRDIEELERHLFDFFLGSPGSTAEFTPRFDVLAGHLRENKLGCKWDFLSFLAFLAYPQNYFPIKPSYFDTLLEFYGIEERVSGYVSWQRYSLLLQQRKD